MKTRNTVPPCDCGRALAYEHCCGRWHGGEAAPDAEALMRSRYSAYVRRDAAYLLATWHPSTRPPASELETDLQQRPTWLGLTVHRHHPSGENAVDESTAQVEFTARFRIGGGSAQRMRELSRFRREDGRWYYVDGDVG